MINTCNVTKILPSCRSCQRILSRIPACVSVVSSRENSNRTSVTRMNRHVYARKYPTMLVLPDGATINIRYHEPCRIIKLPLDLTTLTDKERQARLLRRKPKHKVVLQEEIDDGFDADKYTHLWKK